MLTEFSYDVMGPLVRSRSYVKDQNQIMDLVKSIHPNVVLVEVTGSRLIVSVDSNQYRVGLNSKGLIIRFLPSRSQAVKVSDLMGTSTVDVEPLSKVFLIRMAADTIESVRWLPPRVRGEFIRNCILTVYPDAEFKVPLLSRPSFAVGKSSFRARITDDGVCFEKSRKDPTYRFDSVIGEYKSLEDAILSTLQFLGDGAGFIGLIKRSENLPTRGVFGVFEHHGHYFRTIRNDSIFGIQDYAVFRRGAIFPGDIDVYVRVNYPECSDVSDDVGRAMYLRNKKAGRILPVCSSGHMMGGNDSDEAERFRWTALCVKTGESAGSCSGSCSKE